MNKLLSAAVVLSFGIAHAQTKTEKPATPPPTKTEKPATPPSGAAALPAAAAPAGGAPAEMTPPKPGPESEALKPFAHNVQATGTIPAGAMGPNAPETSTK